MQSTSERVFHVVWKPGSQELLGECWCGRRRDSADPITLWAWMDDHDHREPSAPDPSEPPVQPNSGAYAATRHLSGV
jgi:hypothetical protein